MNNKIDPLIKEAGFCCKMAFFKTYEGVGSSRLLELIEGEEVVTLRALQQQRERYNDGEFKCEKCSKCAKARSA